MKNILGMGTKPNFIQIQSWNDGPEGHNIGNLWPEQNTDSQPALYMRDHSAWQPLIHSFITAWKQGAGVGSMVPPSGGIGAGAMWYRSLPADAHCINDDGIVDSAQQFFQRPYGWDSISNNINWAIVVPGSVAGSLLKVYSNGQLMHTSTVTTGFNYGSIVGRNPGTQYIQLVNTAGSVLMTASGGECVFPPGQCLGLIYNMNYNVMPFITGSAVNPCVQPSNTLYGSTKNYNE
jgi:glucan endo-1,3-alpha-glucosidase